MKKSISVIAFVIVIFVCSGWGFLVHRTINQLAIYQLPKPMRLFFYLYKDSLVKNAPRPDVRRTTDPAEASRHFIDLEAYGDSAAWKMPLHWEDALTLYSKDTLLKYGYVPYHVIFIKNKLTEAFRSATKDSILFYAADLGHYIGDAHVPLHTAVNYDGQFTNQKGIHDLWETSVPEIALDQYKLHNSHHATYLKKPEEAIWQTIRDAHLLLNEMFEVEKDVSKTFTDSTKYVMQYRWGKQRRFYSPAFAKAYNERLKNSINEQLLHSANQVADFWYTAWIDAGSPDLTVLSQGAFTRSFKKSFKKEARAYRKNQLIDKKLLLARQAKDN